MNRKNVILNHPPHRPIRTDAESQGFGSSISLHSPRRIINPMVSDVITSSTETEKTHDSTSISRIQTSNSPENIDPDRKRFNEPGTKIESTHSSAYFHELIQSYMEYDRKKNEVAFQKWKTRKASAPALSRQSTVTDGPHLPASTQRNRHDPESRNDESPKSEKSKAAYKQWLKMKAAKEEKRQQIQQEQEQQRLMKLQEEQEQKKRKKEFSKTALQEWKQKKEAVEKEILAQMEEREREQHLRNQEKWIRGLHAWNEWKNSHPLNYEAIRLNIFPHKAPWQDIVQPQSPSSCNPKKLAAKKKDPLLSPPHLYQDYEICLKLSGPDFLRKYPLLVASAGAAVQQENVRTEPKSKVQSKQSKSNSKSLNTKSTKKSNKSVR